MLISMERTMHNYAISVQWVFQLLIFLAFLSTCCKNRGSFANESLILELFLRGNRMLPAPVKDAGNLCATLELNLSLSESWYLIPTSICPWVQCFIPFSRYPYLNSAIESGYPQTNQMFFAGGRYWNCIFTHFEKIMWSKQGLCSSHGVWLFG